MSLRWEPDPDIRRGRRVAHHLHLHLHLAFVPKYRRDVLDQEMLTACEQVMRGLCTEMGADLREFNSAQDHVHLFVLHPSRLPVSTLVNRRKAVSAHYLRKEFTSRISPHLTHSSRPTTAGIPASPS